MVAQVATEDTGRVTMWRAAKHHDPTFLTLTMVGFKTVCVHTAICLLLVQAKQTSPSFSVRSGSESPVKAPRINYEKTPPTNNAGGYVKYDPIPPVCLRW